jgi:hypothetical protein
VRTRPGTGGRGDRSVDCTGLAPGDEHVAHPCADPIRQLEHRFVVGVGIDDVPQLSEFRTVRPGREGLLPHGVRTVPEAIGEAGRFRSGPGAVGGRRELGDDEGEEALLRIDDMVEGALAQAAAADDVIERSLLVGSGGELPCGGSDERGSLLRAHARQCSLGHNRSLAMAGTVWTGWSKQCYREWTTQSTEVAEEFSGVRRRTR